MRRALALVGRGATHPNPCVGAVVLDSSGEVTGEGTTDPWPGLHHAEVNALTEVPAPDTLVVTLEPCNHTGRTPPCAELIIQKGVRRVVVGAADPDQRAGGGGVERLRQAGIEVEVGVMEDDVEAADPAYFHHRRTGRPLFTLKSAVTLDGQVAALDGTSQWITSEEARRDGHRLRATADAVMIGAGTLRTDDPELTARLPALDRQPAAVVVAGRQALPSERRLWRRDGTLVIGASPIDVDVESVVAESGPDGLPDPRAIADRLSERGRLSVLIEGGPALAGSFWRAGLVDRGVTYVGNLIAGGPGQGMFGGAWETLASGRRIAIDSVEMLGPDLRIEWRTKTE